MDIKTMTIEDIEVRMAEIDKELDTAENLDELREEVRALKERKAEIKAEAEKAKEERKTAAEEGIAVKSFANEEKEERTMDVKEIRNTPEYIKAYAEYVTTGNAEEVRKIITDNATGTNNDGHVPVPTFVDDMIQTAWENDEIFKRVTRTYVPGNDKVAFEASATGAATHAEAEGAPDEEILKIGTVEIIADYVKKWISVSDRALAMGPSNLLNYLYDEFAYQITKAIAGIIVTKILDAPAASTESAVGVPSIDGDVTPANILAAIGNLSDGATDRVFIANGATIAAVKAAALTANYAFDPFFGLTVIQSEAVEGGAIVGDLKGVRVNLPEGDDIRFIFDEYSLAERDLVKVVGKLLMGAAVVRPGMFATIVPTP